jgi:hypothetical protein
VIVEQKSITTSFDPISKAAIGTASNEIKIQIARSDF